MTITSNNKGGVKPTQTKGLKMTNKINKIYLLHITNVGSKFASKGFLFANCVNDGSNVWVSHYLKQFPLQNGGAALRRYVAKWLKQNAGCILKSKKYVKILGSKHCRYIYHDIQTVPKGDRMHFCTIYKIYAEDKKIKFDYLVGKG